MNSNQIIEALGEISDLCGRALETQEQAVWLNGPESDGSWTIRFMDADDIVVSNACELIEKLTRLATDSKALQTMQR